MTRALVVTGDDVGLDRGMTLGVLRAHEDGVVTACSVVANGRDFEYAAAELRAAPALDVGVHLTFVGERPLSPPAEVRSLTTASGAFLPDHRAFAWRYYRGRLDLEELEREARRQIERVRAAGLAVVHLNGHQHLHVLPAVFEVVLRLAAEHGVRYVRIPRDESAPGRALGRWFAVRGLRALAARAAARAAAAGLFTNELALGIRDAGHLHLERILALVPRARGVTELVTHPGIGGERIAVAYRWGYDWDAESRALCDPRLRARIAAEGITLAGIRAVLAS